MNLSKNFSTFHNNMRSDKNQQYVDINKHLTENQARTRESVKTLSSKIIDSENEVKESNVVMHNELDYLKEKVNKLTSLRYEFFTLRNKVHELSDEFLSKYDIYKTELGNLRSNLNQNIDKFDLLNFLENKGETNEIISLLSKLNSDGAVNIDNFSINSTLYNYININRINENIMNSYSEVIKEIDSVEFNNVSINLEVGVNLIDEVLYNIIKTGWINNGVFKPNKSDENSFYVVVFNILKSKDLNKNEVRYNLIYNYTQYNKIFFNLFYVYIIIQQLSMIIHNKIRLGSSYFFCIDEKLILNNQLNHIRDSIPEVFDKYEETRNLKPFNIIDLYKLTVKGKLIDINNLGMGGIIYSLFKKEYNLVLDKLYRMSDRVDSNKVLEEHSKMVKGNFFSVFNPLSRFIFVVSDLKDLTHTIQSENEELKYVNAGSQKFRGSTSYLNNILSRLDKDFRDSMFNHNLHYYGKDALNKNKFSYKNIHMNLGNVRFYSTTRSMSSTSLHDDKDNSYKSIDISSRKGASNNFYVLFDKLRDIFRDEPLNYDTQKKIEQLTVDLNVLKIKNKEGIEFYKILDGMNKELKDELIKCDFELRCLIKNFSNRKFKDVYIIEKLNQNEKATLYLNKILATVSIDYVISILLGKTLNIINSSKVEEENNTAVVFTELGNYLINNYFYELYKKDKKQSIDDNISNKLTYNLWSWRKENEQLVAKFDRIITHGIGALLIEWLRDVNLLEIIVVKSIHDPTKLISILSPTTNLKNVVKETKPFVFPNKIPMIVKPKKYERIHLNDGKYSEWLGGYLLNGEYYCNEIIIKNWRSKENSKIDNINDIYRTINNISCVGYKINKDVLNFIRLYDSKFNLTMLNCSHPLEQKLLEKNKLSKWEKIELERFNSKKFVQENVIGLADVFENIHEFFFPVRLDYRGRMYCDTDYLSYQGSELAKSLLLFSNGEKILKSDTNSINYLKIFGANCFGNKLEKKSFVDRIKWVEDNLDNIRNFHNGELIYKAESKFLFISFCFEFNRWLDCLDNSDTTHFITYLPLQLDASCNGYQHISMLVQDINLAKHLNLTKSSYSDIPQDFYTLVSSYLHEYFISVLKKNSTSKNKKDKLSNEDKQSYERLASLEIKRGVIKKPIMTIPYNASSIQIIKYLQDNFEYDEEKTKTTNQKINLDISKLDDKNLLDDLTVYESNNKKSNEIKERLFIWSRYKEDHNIKLEQRDFLNMYKGLMYVLKEIFPSLTSLSNYFRNVSKICSKLGISIPWHLPTGLIANQSYMELKEVRVKPLNFSNKTFSLKTVVRNKLDLDKQSRALMPNIIHSLDSTSLVLLLDKYFVEFKSEFKNIYAVHDCFAVTANHVDYVVNTLKIVYISLYSEKGYLSQFNSDLIKYIKNHVGSAFSVEELTIVLPSIKERTKSIKLKFPDINEVLKHTYDIQLIDNSSYIIH